MFVHHYIKRGKNHPDYCEDFLIVSEKEKYRLWGVFDGCSSGTDSHFASALIGKLVKSEFQKVKIKTKDRAEDILKNLLFNSFVSLKKIKESLLLDEYEELLSTLILFLYDSVKNNGIIIVAGDGVISINGKLTVVDQNNAPDYPAYYLDEISDKKSFEKWYKNHSNRYFVDKLSDVSISTDGVLSFLNENTGEISEPELKPQEYLLNDKFLINNKSMLGRKLNILRTKHHRQNFDDIAIIRILKSN